MKEREREREREKQVKNDKIKKTNEDIVNDIEHAIILRNKSDTVS